MQPQNKRALITGSSQGLGRAIAQQLAEQGMDIAIHYNDSSEQAKHAAEQIKALGQKVLTVRADLADCWQIEKMLQEVHTGLGAVDVLINNAAIFLPTPMEGFDADAWKQIFQVNVFAPAMLSHLLGNQMKAKGSGRIINILDIASEKPFPSYAGYCASKAALSCLTSSWAKALAPQVQVNGIAPGIIDWPEFFNDSQRKSYLKQTPLGRTAAYDDVAATVLFLVKDAAFVTGQIINVDGGRSLG